MDQAKRGRLHILGIMYQTLSKPAADISDLAPKIVSMKIDIDKIGALIGPGGKNVKALCETYSVKINTDDDGTVTIYGKNAKDAEDAKTAVRGIVSDPEPGIVYNGTVKRIMDFGAFVEILPGKEGLVHISRLSRDHIDKVSDVLKEGQEIPVKLIEVDKMGRLNLSYIDAIDPDGAPAPGAGGGYNERSGSRDNDRSGFHNDSSRNSRDKPRGNYDRFERPRR
jgi:polyribonucleotide nucleotidyltransferase